MNWCIRNKHPPCFKQIKQKLEIDSFWYIISFIFLSSSSEKIYLKFDRCGEGEYLWIIARTGIIKSYFFEIYENSKKTFEIEISEPFITNICDGEFDPGSE